jgi:hypothetical protein
LTSGIIMRKTTEISSPTPAQEMPTKIRPSASTSPKR